MNEETTPNFIFNDNLVEQVTKQYQDKRGNVIFDYYPSRGRIIKIDQLIRFRLITELSLIGHSIEDISNLSVLVNLTKLNLSWNNINSIIPLTKLTQLEILHIGHNKITQIPKSISSLSNLKNLQISNNPISDRNVFLSLKQNLNLTCFDFESTAASCEPDSIIFCIYLLPQLTVVNRIFIDSKMRRDAHRRFGRAEINELSEMNLNLAKENKKYKKIVNLIMQNDIKNPEGIVNEINKLKGEKAKLIEYIKKQDQIIEQLQQKLKENSINNKDSNSDKENNQQKKDQQNPLALVVKDLQDKLYHLQDQLNNKAKENKMLTCQIKENEVLLNEFEQTKSKTLQYKEKIEKLTRDNQLLQSTNVKLYDQIGSLKREQSFSQNQRSQQSSPQSPQIQNINNETIQSIQQDYQDKINDLIKDYNSLKETLFNSQEENTKLTQKYNKDLAEKENIIKLLKDKSSQKDNIISELKLKSEKQIPQEQSNTLQPQSLFQPLLKEVEKQRDFYSLTTNNEISKSCSFEEQTYLLCTQTFKQIQIQYSNLKEKLDSTKNKKNILKKTINNLNDEQKIANEQILSLKSNLDTINRELATTKEKLSNSIQKSDYLQIKSDFDRVTAENEKNSITLKKVISQLSQQKRAKNDLIQTKTATEQENNELFNRIETLSNEIKQKRDKIDEYRFQNSKNERKVLQLKEIINKMTLEKNQLNAQIEQFIIFREEVTTTIAKMEEQQNSTELKYQQKLKSSEEEKNSLQEKIQQLTLQITELSQQNSSFYDAKKENDLKIKQREKDFIEIESQNESLRNQLKQLNETFSIQTQEDKNNLDSLQSQIEEMKKDSLYSNVNHKKEISELQASLDDSLKREKKFERKISKLSEFISNLQNEYQKVLDDNDELKSLIENYMAKEKEANIRELRLKETVNTNEHLFKTLTSKYQDLQKTNDELNEVIDGYDAEKLKYKMNISQLKDQIKELQEEVQAATDEKQNLDSQLIEKNQELITANTQLDEAKSKLNEHDDGVLKIRQQNLDLQNQITDTLIENDNLKKRIQNLEQNSVSNDVYQAIVDKSKEVSDRLDELGSVNEENAKRIENLNNERSSLNQEIENLKKKNQAMMSQIQSSEELNNKTNLIQQKTIDSLKQQLSDAKELINQMKNNDEINEKQKLSELSQLRAEITQLNTNFDAVNDNLQNKENENNRLKEENRNLKKNNDEIQQKFNECYSKFSVLSQKLNDEMSKHEDESEEKNRQIGSAKNKIKNLENENMSLQDQIQQLLIENKSKVPLEKFDDLHQKYTSLKKLQEFESNKNRSSIIQKDDQIEKLKNDLAEKEEKFNDEVTQLSRDLNDKKDLIKKLQKQIQLDNKKIDDLTPLISTKSDLEKCIKDLQSKKNEVEELKSKLNELNSLYQKNTSLLNDSQIKNEKIASSLNQVPLILNAMGTTNSSKLDQLSKKLNPILKLLSIDEISTTFKQKLNLTSKDLINVQSCEETLLEKHKKLLQRVTQVLMSLPIGKPSFNIESNDQLESQLEKLQKLVGLVKNIFDEREKNIENLAEMVNSQHQAVIKIAEVPTDSATVALSFQNYQNSQQIIKEDRSRRSLMPFSNQSPSKKSDLYS